MLRIVFDPTVDWPTRIAIAATVVGVPLVLIGIPIYLLSGGLKTFGLSALERRFRDLSLHERPEPGDVCFRYHTYRGFLLWFVQSEHVVVAPVDDAKRLLGRLLRYNLTWGLLSYGMFFILPLACGNYLAQKRSIRQQAGSAETRSKPDTQGA
jgi:hypothetical protein